MVTDIAAIARHLRGMTAGIDEARRAVLGAASRAEEVTAQAVLSGFVGIAVGMAQVNQAIHEIGQRVTLIDRALVEVVGPVEGAEDQRTPTRTVALLAPASEQLDTVRDGLSAAIATALDATRLAGTVLHGGQPAALVSALGEARRALTEAAALGERAAEQLSMAITAARHLGEQGG